MSARQVSESTSSTTSLAQERQWLTGDLYYFIRYTGRDLDGKIGSTSEEKVAQQVGTYSKGNYYGPSIVLNSTLATQAGVLEMIKGMKTGGTRTAVIPGWLNVVLDQKDNVDDYKTAEAYYNNKSGSNAVYTITLTDKTNDIHKWEWIPWKGTPPV